MKTVKQILDSKGYDVWTIDAEESVLQAITMMAEKSIGALVVTQQEQVVGVMSERDYARNVVLRGRSSRETRVEEIMSAPVLYTELSRTAEECMEVMTEKRIRHLPVLEAGRLIGMISIGDLVKSIIDHQQFMIEQLESYITS